MGKPWTSAVMCQHRFISCNKCTPMGLNVESVGGWLCGTARGTLYFRVNFAVNLRLLKRKLSLYFQITLDYYVEDGWDRENPGERKPRQETVVAPC